jgi:hypothetical protein
MQTHWLEPKRESSLKAPPKGTVTFCEEDIATPEAALGTDTMDDNLYEGLEAKLYAMDTKLTKMERLVECNVYTLCQLLAQILAARQSKTTNVAHIEKMLGNGDTILEESKEIITLPQVSIDDIQHRKDPNSIDLTPEVVSQLRDYITLVAGLYRDNDFPNFEHASHVNNKMSLLGASTGIRRSQQPVSVW